MKKSKKKLKDLKRKIKKDFKYLFGFLTVYTVLLAVYAEAFHSSEDRLFIPFKRLFLKFDNKININEMFPVVNIKSISTNASLLSSNLGFNSSSIGERHGIDYVFVIDNTGSVKSKIKKPGWLNEVIEKLIDDQYIVKDDPIYNELIQALNVGTDSEISVFLVSKINLYNMLLQLEDSSEFVHDFCIWVLGDVSKRILPISERDIGYMNKPTDIFLPAKKPYIKLAIRRVEEETRSFDIKTNIVKLFEALAKNQLMQRVGAQYPSMIVMISDFYHDANTQGSVLEDQVTLSKKAALDVYNTDSIARGITIKPTEKKGVDFSILLENIYGDEYESIEVVVKAPSEYLYATALNKRKLNFYYEDESRILNSIRFLIPENVSVVGMKYNDHIRNMKWKLTDIQGFERNSGDFLFPNEIFRQEVEENQLFNFEFLSGELPENQPIKVKMNFGKNVEYDVEIRFVKLLPFLSALFIALVMMLMLFSIVRISIFLFSIVRLKQSIKAPPELALPRLGAISRTDAELTLVNDDLGLKKYPNIIGRWQSGDHVIEFQHGDVFTQVGYPKSNSGLVHGKYIIEQGNLIQFVFEGRH